MSGDASQGNVYWRSFLVSVRLKTKLYDEPAVSDGVATLKISTSNATVHRGKPPEQASLKQLGVIGPMDRLHADPVGPYPRNKTLSCILTCIDAYNRHLVAVPLKDKTAVAVAEALMSSIV